MLKSIVRSGEYDSGLRVQAGRSLERVALSIGADWAQAQAAWPGSAGDFGSPGVANPAQEPPGTHWHAASTRRAHPDAHCNRHAADRLAAGLVCPTRADR